MANQIGLRTEKEVKRKLVKHAEHLGTNEGCKPFDANRSVERLITGDERLLPRGYMQGKRLIDGTSVRGVRAAARALLRRALLLLLLGSVALGGISPAGLAPAAAQPIRAAVVDAAAGGAAVEQPQSWLLKWQDPAQAIELRGTEVLRRQQEAAVELVRPAAGSGEDVQSWLRRLQSMPGVAYVHPNGGVHSLAVPTEAASEQSVPLSEPLPNDPTANRLAKAASLAPLTAVTAALEKPSNDPDLAKQTYLQQIGALNAWETVRKQTDFTIAIVDTGIDLEHPDLKDNLVPGINLVNPNTPPIDDNGHGTSVAGVVAAAGNNGVGIAGIVWQAKIMPIKALDHRGDGTEQELGEAILYAVRNGAKIVVLSVGLHRHSPYMLDIVQYAEAKGVLLVAAAGNDGVAFGTKAAVKYPAAYPTVLAVGGVRSNNTVDPRSNPGTELDLMAAWNVYTTALGGLYKKEEGTSMAAPQAAAAAALIWARFPDRLPYQIREQLRQTAKDIGASGVDSNSGYGILQVDQAVKATLKPDNNEPNDTSAAAKRFPLDTYVVASLHGSNDQDWFRIDTAYAGTLTIDFKKLVPKGAVIPSVRISQYTNGKALRVVETKLASHTFEFDVKQGQHLLHIEFTSKSNDVSLPYQLTSSFTNKADDYEPNDKVYDAFTLQPRTQTVNGTFHKTADRDWFAVTFTQSGKLSIALSTNTVRIDPELAIQRAGQPLQIFDDGGEGKTEHSSVITVAPGKYYIRVLNAISSESSPVIGTYTMLIDYTPKYVDPNEPNDKSYESMVVKSGTEYVGVIGSYTDVDWFQYRVTSTSLVTASVSGLPSSVDLKLELYDKRMKVITSASTGVTGKLNVKEQLLQSGVYYVKLTSNIPYDSQYYRFKIQSEELVAGFRDIKNHWAEKEISSLSDKGIIGGSGAYRFEPKRAITRAEAVTMVVKSYKATSKQGDPKRFKDVAASHWAYDAVMKAVQNGWIKGFPDDTFKPDQPITRAEMAIIIGMAEGIAPKFPTYNPFTDVAKTDWSAGMLLAMKEAGKINGVERNSYKPKQQASRAEFAVLLYRLTV